MRRPLLLLGIFLSGTFAPALAADSTPKGRYLVATRRPARQVRLRLDRDVEMRRFESVNGFAAELTAAEVAELRSSPEVLFIEEDVERYAIGLVRRDGGASAVREQREALSITPAATSTQEIPYGVSMIGAPQVWNIARGKSIRVGVIDTGILKTHPDLRWGGRTGSSFPLRHRRLVDDFKGGFDFANNDADPDDESGHGTHVAGTIGALDNDFGVVGVAPEVEIYALKVLSGPEGKGNVSSVIRAIDWAIEHKMHVINMSFGSDQPSVLEEQALQRAADAGIVAVAASGNSYDELQREGLSYPAAYSTVISVGAIDSTQTIAAFSQRGSTLKVVGPGVRVLSSAMTVDLTAGSSTYVADLMVGSPRRNVSGPFVFCGLGKIGEFPASVSGKLALIQRGEITFREKSMNAKTAGAIGVIVYNNVPGLFSGTLLSADDPTSFDFPPTVSISKEAGEQLGQMIDVHVSLYAWGSGYIEMSGTSMATPHVTAVAALIWSVAPEATAAQVRQAIVEGAVDLGTPGFDTTFGFGLVNAHNAARRLAPEKFP